MQPVLFVLKNNVFNFEMSILLAVLRQHGIEADILYEEQEKQNLIEKIRAINPCMVGFCTEIAYVLDLTEGELKDSLDILSQIKQLMPNIVTFLGGTHATILPEILKEYNPINEICGFTPRGALVVDKEKEMCKGFARKIAEAMRKRARGLAVALCDDIHYPHKMGKIELVPID